MFVLLDIPSGRLSILDTLISAVGTVVAKGNTLADIANACDDIEARRIYIETATNIAREVVAKRNAIRAALDAFAPPRELGGVGGILPDDAPPVVAEHCACEGDPDTAVIVTDDDGDPDDTAIVPVDADADAKALRREQDDASGAAWFEVDGDGVKVKS